MSTDALSPEAIAQRIVFVRGMKVLIDADLALLYGVETRRLNEQVRRNTERFPADFMFALTASEFKIMRSQFATSSWGGRRKLPLAFTEHGAIMAATVLHSPRAIAVSVLVVRAFVRLRQLANSDLAFQHRLTQLEAAFENLSLKHGVLEAHTQHQIRHILDALRQLMPGPEPAKKRSIGFVTPEDMDSSRSQDQPPDGV